MVTSSLTIIVSGMIAAAPNQGGAAWAVLQYVLGLRELGHRVILVEPLTTEALRPVGATLAGSDNAAYFRRVIERYGLTDAAALLLQGGDEAIGLPYGELLQVAGSADVLFNLSGSLTDEELLGPVSRRVYVDLDPAFTQLWQTVEGIDMRLAGHTHFVTVGLAIGDPDCPVPTLDINWIPTLQPVVLSHWQPAQGVSCGAFTTVANWRGYGSIQHNGLHFGQKAHSLRQLVTLPTRTEQPFVLALAIHPEEERDVRLLAENRWRLVDPVAVAGTPWDYHHFVQGSRGEIGVAKSGYVVSRCGWFSDRSACYLASGRPVIAQATGFDRFLPTGSGLFSFETEEDALDALFAIQSDYHRHAAAARDIAEQHFASSRVLTRILEAVGFPA